MGSAARRVRRLWGALRRELRAARSAALILVLGLILTAGATGYVARQVADDARASLDREAAAAEDAVADRLARYLDALQGTRGLFAASVAVDREEWAAYVRALDLPGRYPGTRSVAYVRWVPAADEAAFLAEMRAGGVPDYAIQGAGGAAAYAPLAYIEPLTAASRRALGFDALADPIRRPALERARDTGLPAATAGTALASEASGVEQRSVILYVPVYRGGGVPGSVEARRAALEGFVLTGWRMDDLMAGVLGPQPGATLAFAITDSPETGVGRLLYASDGAGAATTTAALARPDQRRTLDVAGRTWTLGFVARSGPDRRVPALVAGVGLALSLLLGLLARAWGLRQLAAAAESFNSLFAASEAITINEGGRVVAINPAYTALLGWELADVVGRPGMELVVPVDRATATAWAATGDERPYTVRLRRKDGTTVLVEVVGRAIRYRGRAVRLATLRDVTARARAEAALRASEERFRSAFEHAAIGKALVAPDGRWLRVNRTLCTLLGYTEAALLATTFQTLTYPDDLDADLEQVRRLLQGEIATYQLEKRYIHQDGHLVWGLLSVSLVRDEAGAPLHFIAQIQDIGARRLAEEALATRTRELEAKTREQEAFVYTVAHDLRAPLLSMQGMAGILLEECAPRLGDERLYVERLAANAGRMQALLDELLELSRVGRVDIEPEAVPLDAVVADVCAQLQHSLAARGARVDVAGPLPTVRANRTRMVQLFANLIANAVHYTPPERLPLVRIAAAPHADGWELTVADNGVGIPAAYRDKVLGLFQRLPAGKALNPGGTGAGLAIVARIVDTHGGALWFDVAEGGGTTVHVTLPPVPGVPATIAGLNARREGLPA